MAFVLNFLGTFASALMGAAAALLFGWIMLRVVYRIFHRPKCTLSRCYCGQRWRIL